MRRQKGSHIVAKTVHIPRLNFLQTHKRLIFLLFLVVIGVIFGCVVYQNLSASYRSLFAGLLSLTPVDPGLPAISKAVLSAFLLPLCLLVYAFLFGLTPYGVPFVLLIPAFYGMTIGLSEMHYYAGGAEGIKVILIMQLPYMLLSLIAAVIASAEAIRMSFLIGRQLLSKAAGCGGLSSDFRLYGIRFLICGAISLAASVLSTLARLLFI